MANISNIVRSNTTFLIFTIDSLLLLLILSKIIGWIIDYAPYCIGFLIANSLAGAGTNCIEYKFAIKLLSFFVLIIAPLFMNVFYIPSG